MRNKVNLALLLYSFFTLTAIWMFTVVDGHVPRPRYIRPFKIVKQEVPMFTGEYDSTYIYIINKK